eukprot:116892-Rhodomonas_salina.3
MDADLAVVGLERVSRLLLAHQCWDLSHLWSQPPPTPKLDKLDKLHKEKKKRGKKVGNYTPASRAAKGVWSRRQKRERAGAGRGGKGLQEEGVGGRPCAGEGVSL